MVKFCNNYSYQFTVNKGINGNMYKKDSNLTYG